MNLQQLSEELSSRIEAVAASVVRVEGRRRGSSTGVVWSGEGLIVASHHSVDLEEAIPVGLADGRTTNASVVGRDPGSDLVLLRAAEGGLTPATWADTGGLRVGHVVVGLTRPGRALRAQLGIVSATAESWRTPSGSRLERYLESDLVPEPGYSGGLLLGPGGAALGVNTTGLVRGTGLTVPAEAVRRVVASLTASGRVRRGYLGIGTQPVPLSGELRELAQQPSGLVVLSVQPGSPAAKAGLLLGDVLLGAAGERLTHPAALLPLLDEERVGRELPIDLLRAGERTTKTIVVGERGSA